jgi:hypothetical protein
LGNQTSQFFANVYLDKLDRLIDEKLRPGVWARYVDDLVLFDNDKGRLHYMREAVERELGAARLALHEGKSRIHRCADGVSFLGWRLFPDRARLARDNAVRFGRRMKRLRNDFAAGHMEWDRVEQSVRAWVAHASFGDTWLLRDRLLGRFAFGRGARPLRAGGVLQQ